LLFIVDVVENGFFFVMIFRHWCFEECNYCGA